MTFAQYSGVKAESVQTLSPAFEKGPDAGQGSRTGPGGMACACVVRLPEDGRGDLLRDLEHEEDERNREARDHWKAFQHALLHGALVQLAAGEGVTAADRATLRKARRACEQDAVSGHSKGSVRKDTMEQSPVQPQRVERHLPSPGGTRGVAALAPFWNGGAAAGV